MTLVYSTEGFFCEGEVVKDWRFKMEYGKIILTELELSLVKKSNISLTEMGSSVDNYKDGFVIPLTQIKKAYSVNIQKIYVVVIETRDNLLFSVTLAKNQVGNNTDYRNKDDDQPPRNGFYRIAVFKNNKNDSKDDCSCV